MLDFGFYNMDCMEGMKQFPDKYFDLAIVDPPYGINIKAITGASPKVIIDGLKVKNQIQRKQYRNFNDSEKPGANYWVELNRVCKNQIIWGGELFFRQFSKYSMLYSLG